VTPNELTAAVLEALTGVTDQLPDARWADAPEAERLAVRPAHVAAACATAFALDGESPFEPTPVLAGPAATGAVLDRLALGRLDPRLASRPTDPMSAFHEVYKERPETDWAWTWAAREATPAERALLAAAVSRRTAGAARMLHPSPWMGVTQAGRRAPWTHPQRPLRLAGATDLTIGKRDGTHTLVVLHSGDHTGSTRHRLAYEAVVEQLLLRRPPAVVQALFPDAGRAWSIAVDDDLLLTGVEAAAAAARTALGARRADAAGLPRRPGPACRSCTHAAGCADGAAWLAGPGRLRLGFLPELPRPAPSD
jgi:hypothetical protein